MRRANMFLLIACLSGAVVAQSGWEVHPGLVCDRQWRSPVASVADLPTQGNLPGDARLVLDSGVYFWDGASWLPLIDDDSSSVYVGSEARGSGSNTLCLGYRACGTAAGVNGSVVVGALAGYHNTLGDRNTLVGKGAGEYSMGSDMVCLGYQACRSAPGDGLLYVANSDTESPLIWGDFAAGVVRLGNAVTIRSGGVIHLEPLSGPPAAPEEGDVYYDGTKKDLCVFDGANWTGLKGPC